MIEPKVRRLRDLTELLDTRFEIMGVRIGLDGLLGFVPVVGDIVTTGLSLFVIVEAWTIGCPTVVLLRMALNVLVESLFDMIPILGNFFDIYWKSNTRNMALIEKYVANPRGVKRSSQGVLAAVLFFMIALLLGAGYLTVWIFGELWGLLS